MRGGPRVELRDVIPGHDHGQPALFSSFLALVLGRCLARRRSDGDDGVRAFLEHPRMPRPEEGAEPVPVVAAGEDAAEGEDDEEQERRAEGEPQRRP